MGHRWHCGARIDPGLSWPSLCRGVVMVAIGLGVGISPSDGEELSGSPRGALEKGISRAVPQEGPLPFAHYEERLRQSERWQTMTKRKPRTLLEMRFQVHLARFFVRA